MFSVCSSTEPINGATSFALTSADDAPDSWQSLLLIAPGLAAADRLARRGGDHKAWLLVGALLLAIAKKNPEMRVEANYRVAHDYLEKRFLEANEGRGQR